MTKKTERLIENCKLIKPLEGRILIQPLKLKTYKEQQIVNTGILETTAEGMSKDTYNEEMDVYKETQTETKEVEVNKRFQEAIVLRLPENETRFNIGDTIIYNIGSIFEFDFIKGVSVIFKYDPVAIINFKKSIEEKTIE